HERRSGSDSERVPRGLPLVERDAERREFPRSDTVPMTETVDTTLPSEEDVRQALKSVYDPEIGISIIDLGLVYGVQIDDDSKNVIIDMTLTTPACPLGPIIKTQAHAVI